MDIESRTGLGWQTLLPITEVHAYDYEHALDGCQNRTGGLCECACRDEPTAPTAGLLATWRMKVSRGSFVSQSRVPRYDGVRDSIRA